MIQVTNDELKSGMVLAKSVYRDNGELLLASGYQINQKVLDKLVKLNYPYLWIQEEGTETIIPEEVISEQLSFQSQAALKENMEILKKMLNVQGDTVDNILQSMKNAKKFQNVLVADKVKTSVSDIIDTLLGKDSTLVNLSSLRTKSCYLYQHAIDVTIIAIILANKFHFNRFEIEELALGCMLMDMGMVVIPDSLLEKGARLTFQEFTILKEHTTYGYTILKENPDIPLVSTHVAYQHHERQDGAGYPRGLFGDNQVPVKKITANKGMIHRYAEIAAVADTYISLIAPRPNVGVPKSPEQTIRSLITAAYSQLNRTVVDALIATIPVYPVGTRIVVVKDSKYNMTGYSGIVSRYRHDAPDKPTIMMMFNKRKEKIKPLLIDLQEEPEIRIQFVILA